MEIVRDIKEQMCFVSQDYQKDIYTASSSSDLAKTYKLPDGSQIKLGSERFQCPEAMFQPSIIGYH
jgi:actin beta/gamma 1